HGSHEPGYADAGEDEDVRPDEASAAEPAEPARPRGKSTSRLRRQHGGQPWPGGLEPAEPWPPTAHEDGAGHDALVLASEPGATAHEEGHALPDEAESDPMEGPEDTGLW